MGLLDRLRRRSFTPLDPSFGALIGDLHCHVNAIPFNPHPHAPYERPSATRIRRFVERARARGLRVYLRTPRGDDIGAACGQLALEGEEAEG